MGDTGNMENARARKEAMETAASASSSANRQRLWAGLNRYLAAETEHAHRVAEQGEQGEATAEKPADSPDAGPNAGPDARSDAG